jgi:hypothetical protein
MTGPVDPKLESALKELYESSKKVEVFYKSPDGFLFLKYALVNSKDLPQGVEKLPAFNLAEALEDSVFICEDLAPEKFRTHLAYHEIVESIHGKDHFYAVKKELEAVERDMNEGDLADYCHWRFKQMEDFALKKTAQFASPKVKKILGQYLK